MQRIDCGFIEKIIYSEAFDLKWILKNYSIVQKLVEFRSKNQTYQLHYNYEITKAKCCIFFATYNNVLVTPPKLMFLHLVVISEIMMMRFLQLDALVYIPIVAIVTVPVSLLHFSFLLYDVEFNRRCWYIEMCVGTHKTSRNSIMNPGRDREISLLEYSTNLKARSWPSSLEFTRN